jgi:hypothetical protein
MPQEMVDGILNEVEALGLAWHHSNYSKGVGVVEISVRHTKSDPLSPDARYPRSAH